MWKEPPCLELSATKPWKTRGPPLARSGQTSRRIGAIPMSNRREPPHQIVMARKRCITGRMSTNRSPRDNPQAAVRSIAPRRVALGFSSCADNPGEGQIECAPCGPPASLARSMDTIAQRPEHALAGERHAQIAKSRASRYRSATCCLGDPSAIPGRRPPI
jgi:hypothetical protein